METIEKNNINNLKYYPTQTVMYMYSHALTKCECGKDLILAQQSYGNSTYSGKCECGIDWRLKNKLIWQQK